jgi:peptide/nickel transport system permease protein
MLATTPTAGVAAEPSGSAAAAPETETAATRRRAGAPLLRFIARRVLLFVPTAVGATFLTFLLVKIIPGGPAHARLGEDATPEAIAVVEQQLGLDRPLAVQYFSWLGRVIRGDLGDSFQTGQSVNKLIGQGLPITAELVVLALIGTLVFALPVGVYVARRRHSRMATAIRSASGFGLAVPDFFLALVLINVFAGGLAWLPRLGAPRLTESPLENLRHLILPVIPKVLGASAIVIRQVGAAMGDALASDHTRTARAMGLPERTIVWRYAFRSAMPTVLNVFALLALGLLGSTLIIEKIFVLPGMGSALVNGIAVRDYTLIQGIVLIYVLIALVLNLIIDVVVGILDPATRSR